MDDNDSTQQRSPQPSPKPGRLTGWLRARLSTQAAGQAAEDLAAAHLVKHGLRIVTRNYRCRGGEIDLIAGDGRTLVFVEVRLRRHAAFGGAGASITRSKQQRIILAARHYLAGLGEPAPDCRFDCVLLTGTEANQIEWLCDAFAAD